MLFQERGQPYSELTYMVTGNMDTIIHPITTEGMPLAIACLATEHPALIWRDEGPASTSSRSQGP